jgi:tetratricopeptide (TPR) repeat protein
MEPNKVEAIINLGQLYKENQNHEKALEYFKKAIALNPRMMDVRLALSDVYFRLQELEELVGQCDALLQELNLPRDFILNSFNELSALYDMIGDELGKQGRKELSLLAHQVSFLISPSQFLKDGPWQLPLNFNVAQEVAEACVSRASLTSRGGPDISSI